jgi:predicted nucleotidyltransferase
MAEEPPRLDAEALLRQLTEGGVDFVVIGGIARVLLASARVTKDLDISYSRDEQNVEALGAVLEDLEARLRGVEEDVPFVPDAVSLDRVQVLTLSTKLGWLDILAFPSGAPAYEALRRNAETIEIGDFEIRVASIDDMIAMKRAAGRMQDLADIEELESIRRRRSR